MKKLFLFSISAIIMLSMITSCSNPKSLLDFIDNDADKINLDGYVFKLMQTERTDNSGGLISDENIFGYPITTTPNDAAHKRISEIEKELNCKIKIETTSHETQILVAQNVGGKAEYDAVYSSSNYLTVDFSRNKILLPVELYGDYIDFTNTEKYGAANIAEVNSFNGSIYGVSPITWIYKQPRSIGLTVFNMDLVSTYGKANPREYLEKNEWTWETFEHVVDDYYVKDGEKEIFSLATRSFDLNRLAALSNGVKYADITETGDALKTYNSANLTEAFNWYTTLATNYAEHFALSPTSETMDWPDVSEHFCIQQDTMACITAPNVLFYDIIYKVPAYTVMPFPCGPRSTYGEWTAIIEAAESFSVFIGAKEPEIAFKIIDMLCEPLEGFETENDIISFLAESVLYAREDAEVVLSIKDKGQYTYWPQSKSWSIGDFYGKAATGCKTRTAAELVEAYKDKLESYLEEFVVPNLAINQYYN